MCGIWTVKTPSEKKLYIYLLHSYPTVYLPELSTKLKTVYVQGLHMYLKPDSKKKEMNADLDEDQ